MTTKYEYMRDYYKYTNWRFLCGNNKTTYRSRKKGVWVLLDTYRRSCFIYGLTIKDFFQISKSGNYHTHVDVYWDVPYLSQCKSCNGAGKFDWIGRITGPPSFEKIRHIYVRDKSKILKFHNTHSLKDHIFAPTKVFKGERICKDCMGSGMNIAKENIEQLMLYDTDKIIDKETNK